MSAAFTLPSLTATLLRLFLLGAILAVPAAVIPVFASAERAVVESSFRPASGAGLVIMVGLQRARG